MTLETFEGKTVFQEICIVEEQKSKNDEWKPKKYNLTNSSKTFFKMMQNLQNN